MTHENGCSETPPAGQEVSALYFTKAPGEQYMKVYAQYPGSTAWVPMQLAFQSEQSLQQARDAGRNIAVGSGSYEDAHFYLRSADGNNMATAYFTNTNGGGIQAGNRDGLAPLNLQPLGGRLNYGASEVATQSWAENAANKSTTTTLGASDVLFPTQKAVKTYVDTALSSYIPSAQKGTANGVATLDSNGRVPVAQIPPVAITDTFVVATQAAMLALTAETGDVAVRTDLNKSYILKKEPASTIENWVELKSPTIANTDQLPQGTANLYFTNARARSAISATAPLAYNSSTGVFSIAQAGAAANGFLSAADWTTFNGKEPAITKNTAFNKNFGTAAGTIAEGSDSRIVNGQTAYAWGNHAAAGYIKSYTETDPVWTAAKVNTLTLKADIPSGANLNLYAESGIYHQLLNSSAAAGTNYPAPYAGKLEVTASASGAFIYQTYHVYRNFQKLYYRTCYNGSWSAWETMAKVTDLQLSLTGNNLGIAGGNTVALPTASPEIESNAYGYGRTVGVSPGWHTRGGIATGDTRYFQNEEINPDTLTDLHCFVCLDNNDLLLPDAANWKGRILQFKCLSSDRHTECVLRCTGVPLTDWDVLISEFRFAEKSMSVMIKSSLNNASGNWDWECLQACYNIF